MRSYLGESKVAAEFARQFLEKRNALKKSGQQQQQQPKQSANKKTQPPQEEVRIVECGGLERLTEIHSFQKYSMKKKKKLILTSENIKR